MPGAPPDGEDDPNDDWREAEKTRPDVTAVGEVLDRDMTPVTPGMVGFCEGYDLGFKRGLGAAMLALRDELIRGGTDPGTAALVAQKLGRACGVRGD